MDPYAISPEERQRLVAETLRGQAALQAARQQGSKFDDLAAISQLANNPAAAKAAQAAAASAQDRFAPKQMGNQGFSIPGTGEFVASPMYMEEKMDSRAQQRGMQQDRLLQQAQLAQEKLETQKQLQAERLAQQAQIAEQNRALRMTLGAIAQGNRADKAADAREIKINRDVDSNVQRLANNIEKSGGAEFGSALDIVKGTLEKYKPGQLPAYGRIASAIPNALLDNEGQTVRADMQQAANILLKARSGAAVTESEMRRFLTEVASGAGMSEEALRKGWANVEKTYGARMQNIYSGFDDNTVNEYVKRGGIDRRKKAEAPAPSDDDALINKYLK